MYTSLYSSLYQSLYSLPGLYLVGWDAGHGVDQYGHKHWEVSGRSESVGSGVPLAVVNTSDGSQLTQETAFREFRRMVNDQAAADGLQLDWNPRCWTIDKDSNSLRAIKNVFGADTLVAWCLFHLLVWLYCELRRTSNGVPADVVDSVAFEFRRVACEPDKASFVSGWADLRARWGQTYPLLLLILNQALLGEWEETWPMYVRYEATTADGEPLLPYGVIRATKTNMLSEAAVKYTKYTVLSGVRNRRKDHLLAKLLWRKLGAAEVDTAHRNAGYVRCVSRIKLPTQAARAKGIALANQPGAVNRVRPREGQSHPCYSVMSRTTPVIRWEVILHPMYPSCDCPMHTSLGDACKHIMAAKYYEDPSVFGSTGRPAAIQPRERAKPRVYRQFREGLPAIAKPGPKARSISKAAKHRRRT
jgi:hypothetical protein